MSCEPCLKRASHLKSLSAAVRTAPAGAEDFVVDALALHDHLGSLKPLFADPRILKVAQALGMMLTAVHLWAASLA